MTLDLRTRYLGLELRNPLVASASPLTGDLDGLRALEAAGAAAVVLPSLFEEQIERDELEHHRLQEYGTESYAEALDYFVDFEDYNFGPEGYLELVASASQALSIPVIGSLNGASPGGWVEYAQRIEDAGANALELNAYLLPVNAEQSGQSVEQRYIELVRAVRARIDIPLAVKVGPYFSSVPGMARAFADAGANGLVLFNRFLEPDIDLESFEVVPRLVLSDPEEMRLPLRWMAILHGQLECSLAASSGVHGAEAAVKMLLAGADVVMMTSLLLRRGPEHLAAILEELQTWFEEREYASIEQAKGSMSRRNCPNPGGFDRANYMRAIVSYSGKPI